jgi:hypothetical protein
MGHHQNIKPRKSHKKRDKAPKENGHIDLVQRVGPRKQNVQENAQRVEGATIRLSLVFIPNPLSLAGSNALKSPLRTVRILSSLLMRILVSRLDPYCSQLQRRLLENEPRRNPHAHHIATLWKQTPSSRSHHHSLGKTIAAKCVRLRLTFKQDKRPSATQPLENQIACRRILQQYPPPKMLCFHPQTYVLTETGER